MVIRIHEVVVKLILWPHIRITVIHRLTLMSLIWIPLHRLTLRPTHRWLTLRSPHRWLTLRPSHGLALRSLILITVIHRLTLGSSHGWLPLRRSHLLSLGSSHGWLTLRRSLLYISIWLLTLRGCVWSCIRMPVARRSHLGRSGLTWLCPSIILRVIRGSLGWPLTSLSSANKLP